MKKTANVKAKVDKKTADVKAKIDSTKTKW